MRKLLVLPVLAVALTACSIPMKPASSSSGSSYSAPAPTTVEAAAETIAAGTIPGSGEFLAPEEVAVGTYKSPGPDGSSSMGCYRATYADRGRDKIQTTDVGKSSAIIEVTKTTKLIRTRGCLPFKKVS